MNTESQINMKLAACVLLLTEGTQVMRTALNKHLFFADIAHFIGTEQAKITKATYRKLPYGPVPDSIDWVRSSLIQSGHLSESIQSMGVYYQYQYTATERVNFQKVREKFSPQELIIITNVKQSLGKNTATELSNWSHQFEPWKSSAMNEELDFNRALRDDALRRFLQDKQVIPYSSQG